MERQIKLPSLRLGQILELLRFILGQEHTVKAPSPFAKTIFLFTHDIVCHRRWDRIRIVLQQGGLLCICQASKRLDLSAKNAANGFLAATQKKARSERIQKTHPSAASSPVPPTQSAHNAKAAKRKETSGCIIEQKLSPIKMH